MTMWMPVAKTTNKKRISEMISRKENETDELETKKTDGKDDDENGTEKKKRIGKRKSVVLLARDPPAEELD